MRFIRKYVLNNLKLKALSLVLAAMLWFAISYTGEMKMTISVPVTAEKLRKGFFIGKMDTDAVLVTIGGPISILKNLRARDIRVTVDLSGSKEGPQVFTLEKESVTVPKGVKVADIKPDFLAVRIDKAVEKRLRVVVKLDEKWKGRYEVQSWYPHYVVVEGAAEELQNRQTIETAPVDGDFREKEEELYVPLAVKGLVAKKVTPETVVVRIRRN